MDRRRPAGSDKQSEKTTSAEVKVKIEKSIDGEGNISDKDGVKEEKMEKADVVEEKEEGKAEETHGEKAKESVGKWMNYKSLLTFTQLLQYIYYLSNWSL